VDNFSIKQFGKPLDVSKYSIDIEARVFSSIENNLVLDFGGLSGWTFITGYGCTFDTYSRCIFNTKHDCIFTTNGGCTFNTDVNCNFYTGNNCTFFTGHSCTFKTGNNCTFMTSTDCNFHTSNRCIFRTGGLCFFDTGGSCSFLLYHIKTCKFKNYDGYSIILDLNDGKRYVLNLDFKKLLKVMNG